ncbi:MAG: glutathione S-transferase family protein [Candidatus Thalassarchaeaceae archaeon]|jgi:glutathione S-transferase|nr:glutathione S-transferase family protein [Candidatus Thalassarchaeaceae archaeon]
MGERPVLHMLHTCPFCWKIRSIAEHLNIDYQKIQVNAMKTKKELKFTNGWEKVPVWTEVDGSIIVDSTPIMKHIDVTYNDGELWYSENVTRRDEWIEWVDANLSKATIPILYGGLFSALKTTTRVSKLEKFGFFSKRIYAWMGFPIMWGFIARSRIKKDGRKPKQLWHDLLTEFTDEFRNTPFFGGQKPDLVDLAAFGYMRSISPFPQFSQLEEHVNGIAWYRRVEATLKVQSN